MIRPMTPLALEMAVFEAATFMVVVRWWLWAKRDSRVLLVNGPSRPAARSTLSSSTAAVEPAAAFAGANARAPAMGCCESWPTVHNVLDRTWVRPRRNPKPSSQSVRPHLIRDRAPFMKEMVWGVFRRSASGLTSPARLTAPADW